MSNTPYYDAYERMKASNKFSNTKPKPILDLDFRNSKTLDSKNLSFARASSAYYRKKYIILSSGEIVLQDVEFLDGMGNPIYTHDVFELR